MNPAHLFFIAMALALVNSLLAYAGLRQFLARHPRLADRAGLDTFKQVVRRQMYQALLQLVLLGAANLAGLYGLVTGRINLLVIIAANVVIFTLAKHFKKNEEEARSLEVDDPSLSGEYETVCDNWLKKALPGF